jgi:hypothetical protein
MSYFFLVVTIAGGLLHEIKTTGFETEKACYEYAEQSLNTYIMFGHQILEAECYEVEKGA